MNALHSLPPAFWWLLGLCLLGFGLLWWALLGSARFARRRVLRRRIEALGPPETTSEFAALDAMRQAIAHARAPELQSAHHPLYGMPWFLFLGDAAADVPGLLATARRGSPLPQPESGDGSRPEKAFWRWWFLRTMTAIETSPATVGEPTTRRERSLWYQALMALTEQRERLPLNGIVVCVSADRLLEGALAMVPAAARLRHLIDDAVEHLRLRLPVYLVVTGLERLSGYGAVRAALPPEVLEQALGHRLPDEPAPGAAQEAPRFDALFAPVVLRLHALRMALLRSQTVPAGRLAVHRFVEEMRALQPGLRVLSERLFQDGRGPRPARWRGLYFTAAGPDAEGGAFVADLFQRFLPGDQPLSQP